MVRKHIHTATRPTSKILNPYHAIAQRQMHGARRAHIANLPVSRENTSITANNKDALSESGKWDVAILIIFARQPSTGGADASSGWHASITLVRVMKKSRIAG